MKMRNILAGVTIFLLPMGGVLAKPDANPQNAGQGNSCSSSGLASLSPACFSAPEIDAASGTSAIALLAGVLLLAGERSRSKRS